MLMLLWSLLQGSAEEDLGRPLQHRGGVLQQRHGSEKGQHQRRLMMMLS